MRRPTARALGLLTGVALDAAVGDPRRFHPVAGFGRLASHLERAVYGDSRGRGILFTGVCVGAPVMAGILVERAIGATGALRGVIGWSATAAATWTVVGSRMLRGEGDAIAALLIANDLTGARKRLPNLVGRDPSVLDADGITRAAVESVAENTSDAVVAPLLAGALFGIPGLLGYRAINTLDAMVGHRSPRYEHFGWASARLDDLANLLPARVTGVITAGLSTHPTTTWRTTRRFARQHPSPNSGWCEAAYAGALDLRLGGRNVYTGRVEVRPTLGTGRMPTPADLPRATRLLARITPATAALSAVIALGTARRPSTLEP